MASAPNLPNGSSRRRHAIFFRLLLGALGLALIGMPASSVGQRSSGIGLVPGNAAVTGFSGAVAPPQIAPGVDPAEATFIDLDGPSLRVVDLQHMGGPAAAQLVGAPKPFTVEAKQIGQVFGVALDNAAPPNVYVAASSAYGLPIVAPGPDGKPQHVRAGAPNASFMPGLWGAAAPDGGPGTIWKIDGTTGAVSLFANVMPDKRPNSGAALGALAFDPDSNSLFVADRESGFIHRFALNGIERGRYDHGVSGRAAQGLPPVQWNPAAGVDITGPQFDSTDPATWSFAPPERRVFGLAVFQHRLYYAIADGLQIWSVGLRGDGSFANDAIIELVVPPASGPTEISKITVDGQGRMVLAERPAPTGAFDFEALAYPAVGRVLRYAVIGTAVGARRIWQKTPDEFPLGFAGDFRNGNGGVEIGYQYDQAGELEPGSCDGFLWMTGEQLRKSDDPAIAARVSQGGPADVDGLQGNGGWLVRRDDKPPFERYFVDYDDRFDDDLARGHLGDLAIQRCNPTRGAAAWPFGGSPPPGGGYQPPGGHRPPGTNPPGDCPPNQVRRASTGTCEPNCPRPGIQIGGVCCASAELAAAGVCSNSGPGCSPGFAAIGPSNFCCSVTQVFTNASGAQACCSGTIADGKCLQTPSTPVCPPGSTDPKCCAGGYVSTGSACCLASQMTADNICCPAGEMPSAPDKSRCVPLVYIPSGPQCCAPGLIPAASGTCCAAANVTTSGVCCSAPVDPKNRTYCPEQIESINKCAPGYTRMPDGSCCASRLVSADGATCKIPAGLSPPPTREPSPGCPAGTVRDRDGDCVPRQPSGGEPPGFGAPPGMPRQPYGGEPPRFEGPGGFGAPPGGNRFSRPPER